MNKKQIFRASKIAEMGCIVCRNEGLGETPCQVHHTHTGAGGRRDHNKIIGLCETHHTGAHGIHKMGRKPWQMRFGSEDQLLNQTKQELGE